MPYALLDDGFHSHPKTLAAGNAAVGLWTRAISYCSDHLTDGYVPASWAKQAGTKREREKLVEVGLWVEVYGGEDFSFNVPKGPCKGAHRIAIPGPGFLIPDYLAYNPPRAQIEVRREERRIAGAKGAASRWGLSNSHDNSYGDSHSQPHDHVNAPSTQYPDPSTQEDQRPAEPDEDDDFGRAGALKRLLSSLKDQDDGTKAQLRGYVESRKLSVADIEWARECATGPGVKSPTRVAVAELQRRAGERDAA